MRIVAAMIVLFAVLLAQPAPSVAATGSAAPDFTLTSHEGKPVKLSDYKGKIVVLEWYNKDCPFVKKHYGSGNMQGLQEKYRAKGVVWLSIISSSEDGQGYLTQTAAAAHVQSGATKASALLLDPTGATGQAYGARTTPHMYLIDAKGTLVYVGAIDDRPSAKAEDIAGARNYVAENLDALLSGKPVATANTKSYGCGVKYGKKS